MGRASLLGLQYRHFMTLPLSSPLLPVTGRDYVWKSGTLVSP